ncbi:MAG: efflux RND transporter periplasmic adaptor subunit [Pseudomonadota bacterium]|nr:efflux RND transporter periplasmic adaptor subunit [Pseudomonadota bacterium]
MKKHFRYVVVIGVLVALAFAGWWYYQKTHSKQTLKMTTEAVKIADIQDTILANGTLKPNKMVAVGAQLSGRLISLEVGVGQRVKQGDLIGQIDPETKRNDLLVSQAALQNVRAQRDEKVASLELAESSRARKAITVQDKATSQADYDSAVATVKQTKAQISSLEAQIQEAEVAVKTSEINLASSNVVAPIDGTVLSVVTQEGQTVNAVQSAPTIVILGQLDVMSIRAEISEVDVVKVRSGQDVYFTILGEPDHRYDAELEMIEPAPESIKNDSSLSSSSSSSSTTTSTTAIYYNAVFRAPNPDGKLRTYMTAEVHVAVASAKQILVIPSAALGTRNADGSYPVEVVGAGDTVSMRNVKIGIDNRINAQVLEGLAEGERVVTGRYDSSPSKSSASLDNSDGGPGQ